MLPKTLITVMRIVIDKNIKPFSNMQYSAKENKFTGTDSFVLFEFIPKTFVYHKDFFLTRNQIFAIEKLLAKHDSQLSIWGDIQAGDKTLIQFAGDDGAFYLAQESREIIKYKQEDLFGINHTGVDVTGFSNSMKKFVRAGKIINQSMMADGLEKALVAKHEDDFGFYTIGITKAQKK